MAMTRIVGPEVSCSTLDIFEKLDYSPPSDHSRKSIDLSELVFPFKNTQGSIHKTAHEIDKVIKKKKITADVADMMHQLSEQELQTYLQENDLLCFLKNIDPDYKKDDLDGLRAQRAFILEAIANRFHALQIPHYVPRSKIVYDAQDNYRVVGLVSKALPHYKANFEKPLREEELNINLLGIKVTEVRMQLQSLLRELDRLLTRPEDLFSTINYAINPMQTAVKVKAYIQNFQHSDHRNSHKSLNELKQVLQARKNHIAKNNPETNSSWISYTVGFFCQQTRNRQE